MLKPMPERIVCEGNVTPTRRMKGGKKKGRKCGDTHPRVRLRCHHAREGRDAKRILTNRKGKKGCLFDLIPTSMSRSCAWKAQPGTARGGEKLEREERTRVALFLSGSRRRAGVDRQLMEGGEDGKRETAGPLVRSSWPGGRKVWYKEERPLPVPVSGNCSKVEKWEQKEKPLVFVGYIRDSLSTRTPSSSAKGGEGVQARMSLGTRRRGCLTDKEKEKEGKKLI